MDTRELNEFRKKSQQWQEVFKSFFGPRGNNLPGKNFIVDLFLIYQSSQKSESEEDYIGTLTSDGFKIEKGIKSTHKGISTSLAANSRARETLVCEILEPFFRTPDLLGGKEFIFEVLIRKVGRPIEDTVVIENSVSSKERIEEIFGEIFISYKSGKVEMKKLSDSMGKGS